MAKPQYVKEIEKTIRSTYRLKHSVLADREIQAELDAFEHARAMNEEYVFLADEILNGIGDPS